MIDYLKRLTRTGAAYTASSVLAKLFAVALLPVYTRYVDPAGYGKVEILLVTVIVLSIFFRLGAIEAVLRFYHQGGLPREEVVRTGFWALLATATAGTVIALALAGPIGELLLRGEDLRMVRIAAGGLWFFTFYELLLALFRLDERAVAYAVATVTNVLVTVPLTVVLVVFADLGAEGLLIGNFGATAVIVLGLLFVHRRRFGRPTLIHIRAMLRFGLPTMPAELSLYLLNFADRVLLVGLAATRVQGLAAAGLYSIAIKFAQVISVFVRAFQLAWPPLAYSITDHGEARRVYPRILTYYLLLTAGVVTALALMSRWIARLLVSPEYFGAHRAAPLIATGVALYGGYLVLVLAVARTGKTRSLFPITLMALAVNVGLCVLLIPRHGIVGAGLALVGAYVVLTTFMYLRARRLLDLRLEWGRIARIVAIAVAVSLAGDALLPESGAVGLLLRMAALVGYPALLYASRFFRPGELRQAAQLRHMLQRAGGDPRRSERPGDAEPLPDSP